ncbi:MAG: hypothetical protein ACR2HR_09445 [Euzebya sp.]
MTRRRRSWSLCGLALLVLAGCQLVDQPGDTTAGDQPVSGDVQPALGSPEEDWPSTLTALRAFADPEALAWQDQPVLADLAVWLQPDLSWERVRLTYVAADADRILTLRSRPDQLRVDRPVLQGLQLLELPGQAVAEMEPFPVAALEPVDLAAAAAQGLSDCGAGGEPARAVLYATGAPAAWDGTQWTRNPSWRATVVTESAGVVVDPTSGQAFAPLTCVEPVLLSAD